METKHTPGPWTVIKRGERGTYHIPQSKTNEIRNADANGNDGEDVADADARLISASPRMYSYVERRAENGCAEAKEILEAIHE